MPPRVRRNHRQEPDVQLGGADPLSWLARVNYLPLCSKTNPFSSTTRPCTRSAGHDEDPGSKHVHVHLSVVTAIWEDES